MRYFAQFAAGRVLLHLVCLVRTGRVAWHVDGIKRQFA